MKTLYLHGFSGKPINFKDWISPKIDYKDIPATIKQINTIIDKYNITEIVATSIGCYFAIFFYNKVEELYLINPCIKPYTELSPNYNLSDDYLNELKEINPIKNDTFHYSGGLYVELGDERIDQEQNLLTLVCNHTVIYEGGNHQYTRKQETLEEIDNKLTNAHAEGLVYD